MHRRSRSAALALGVALVLLASCGLDADESDAFLDPSPTRLELSAVGAAAAWPAPQVTRRLDVADEAERWRVDAPAYGLAPAPGAAQGNTSHVLAAGSGRAALVRFHRKGQYDLRRFDAVRLTAAFQGAGGARVLLRHEGRTVASSERVVFPELDVLTDVVLPLRIEDDGAASGDELVIDVPGTYRSLALDEVAFLHHPLGALVPDPGAGARLHSFGGDARRCVGLLPDRPLLAAGVVPEGGRLVFSWGVQRAMDATDAMDATAHVPTGSGDASDTHVAGIEVRVTSGDAVLSTHRVPLDGTEATWRQAQVDLSAHAGREVTLRFALVGAPLVSAVMGEPWLFAPRDAPPTVLLITSDTHRGDHVGALGRVPVETPALDALAARGVLFEDAWVTVNNTTPSHAALFTALHPRDTAVLDNFTRLASRAETLAEAFAEAGWATWAAVSTSHLGPEDSGLGQGFGRVAFPGSGTRPAQHTVDDVLRWLPDAEGRPLFLWVHVFDAHVPYEPPAEVLAEYWDPSRDPRAGALPDGVPAAALPPSLGDITDLEYPRAAYRAEIAAQDRVLAALLGTTRIVAGHVAFVADHGECFGEDGLYFRHEGLQPAVLHVPLVLAGPDVPEGVRTPSPVVHTDLGRTLLDLAGLDETPFPGRNLLRQLDADAPRVPRFGMEAYGRSASVEMDGLLCVLHLFARDTPWSLAHYEPHRVQLFDVLADPACERDLVDERTDDARRLRALLLAWLDAADAAGLADDTFAPDPSRHEELSALGYVTPDASAVRGRFVADDCAWCVRMEGR